MTATKKERKAQRKVVAKREQVRRAGTTRPKKRAGWRPQFKGIAREGINKALDCPICRGSGEWVCDDSRSETGLRVEPCPACDGTGFHPYAEISLNRFGVVTHLHVPTDEETADLWAEAHQAGWTSTGYTARGRTSWR